MHRMCCQATHRRIELEPREEEEVGNAALGQDQEHVRLNIKTQGWNF